MIAVHGGKFKVASKLIKLSANIHSKNAEGFTTLIYAAQKGNLKILEKLIKAVAEIDAIDQNGNTALMHAAETGNKDALKILIQHGANLYLPNKKGLTALDIAKANSHNEEALNMLLKLEESATDLHQVCKAADLEALSKLEDNLPEIINLKDKTGNTPLQNIVSHLKAQLEVAKKLLSFTDETGNSLIDSASSLSIIDEVLGDEPALKDLLHSYIKVEEKELIAAPNSAEIYLGEAAAAYDGVDLELAG